MSAMLRLSATANAHFGKRAFNLVRGMSSVTSSPTSPENASPESSAPTTPFAEGVTVKVTDPSPLSNRKKFKQVEVNQAVLQHLDRLNLGFVQSSDFRRRMRKYRESVAAEQGMITTTNAHFQPPRHSLEPAEWTPPPAPFGVVGSRYSSATRWEELPKNRAKTCEIALAGRSNVGKSTLLNVLAGLRMRPQKRAAVSPTPGETKALEFYRVGRSAPLTLVDMPGYGFSFAKDEVVDEWSELMVNYLRHRNGAKGRSAGDAGDTDRAPLKRLVLLVDARHGLKEADKEFLQVVYDKKRTATTSLPINVKLPSQAASLTSTGKRRRAQSSVELVPPSELLGQQTQQKKEQGAEKGSAATAAAGGGGGGGGGGGRRAAAGLVDTDATTLVAGGGGGRGAAGKREGPTVGALAAAVADPPKLQVVLTKCDLVKRKDLVRRVTLLREDLRDLFPPGQSHHDWGRLPVVMLSSLEDKGIRELQRELGALTTYKGEVQKSPAVK